MPSLVQHNAVLPADLDIPREGTVLRPALHRLIAAQGVVSAYIPENDLRRGGGWALENCVTGGRAATPIATAPGLDWDVDGAGHVGLVFSGALGGIRFQHQIGASYSIVMAIRPSAADEVSRALIGYEDSSNSGIIVSLKGNNGGADYQLTGRHEKDVPFFTAATGSTMLKDQVYAVFVSYDGVAESLTVGIGNSDIDTTAPGTVPAPAAATGWMLGGSGAGATLEGAVLAAIFMDRAIYSPDVAKPVNDFREAYMTFTALAFGGSA